MERLTMAGTHGSGDDLHLVLGQGSRLVGADGRGVTHDLAGLEMADEVVVPEHAGCARRPGRG